MRGLILENTFTSVLDMAGVMLPVLKWFIGRTNCHGPKLLNPFVRSPWSTVDIIGQVLFDIHVQHQERCSCPSRVLTWCSVSASQIKEPILFLTGMRDEMVPPVHMRILHDAATASVNRTFIEFPTGMHMDTWLRGGERYWRVIQLFVERCSVIQEPASETGERTAVR